MSRLDEILDAYWDEIKKDEKLIGTIQREQKQEIKELMLQMVDNIVDDIFYSRPLNEEIEKL